MLDLDVVVHVVDAIVAHEVHQSVVDAIVVHVVHQAVVDAIVVHVVHQAVVDAIVVHVVHQAVVEAIVVHEVHQWPWVRIPVRLHMFQACPRSHHAAQAVNDQIRSRFCGQSLS